MHIFPSKYSIWDSPYHTNNSNQVCDYHSKIFNQTIQSVIDISLGLLEASNILAWQVQHSAQIATNIVESLFASILRLKLLLKTTQFRAMPTT